MNLKKFLCAALTAAMLGTTAVPAMAAETVGGVTKVEFEDYAATVDGIVYKSADENASGGEWIKLLGAGATEATAALGIYETKVNVPESGYYELKFRGTKSDGSLSNISYSVNDGETFSLVNAAISDSLDVTLDGWFPVTIHTQTTKQSIPLAAGENDITFRVASRPSYNDYYAVMDYYTVEKKSDFTSVGADGTATIECEDFSPNVVDKEEASGGKYVQVESYDGSSVYKLKTYVNVSKQGYYKISVAANDVTAANGTASHLSPLHVIAGGKDIKITTGNSTRNTEINYSGFTGTAVNLIQLNDSFLLNEGTNLITLQFDPRADGAGVFGTLDCIKLEEVGGNTIGASGKTVLEAEDLFGGGQSYDEASGGKYLLNYSENKEQVTLSGVVYADQDGFYKLGYDGTHPDVSERYMSPFNFKVNGNALASATAGEYKYTSELKGNWKVYSNTLPNVFLNKGKNTIEITATRAEAFNAGTNMVFFVLDNLTFENVTKTIGLSGGTIECEDFSAKTVEAEGASGGKYVKVDGETAPYTLDMYVNIETAGNYKIGVGASDYFGRAHADSGHGTAQHLSKIHLIAGGVDTAIGGDNVIRDGSVLSYPAFTGAIVEMLYLKEAIYLDAGLNKISIQCDNAQNKGVAYASLDCVKLSYADTIPAEGGKLEIETGISGYTKTSAAASGGKYVAFDEEDTSNDPTIDLVANTSAAGNYQLMIAAAANFGDDLTAELSSAQMVVNNSDAYDINSDNCIIASDVYYLDSESKYPFRNYYINTPVALNEGANTINIYAYVNEDFIRSAFDYIEVKPIQDFGTLTAAASEVSMNVGDERQMTILKENGETLSNSDAYMITYSSSNEEAAMVDGNGIITANNGGEAIITAAVKENAITEPKTVTMTVKVTDNREIYFSGINTENGISYNVVVNSALDKAANVYTAVYDSTGKLVSADVANISAGTTGITPVTASGAAIPAGGYAKLFVWTEMTPVLTTTVR